ncbi:amino acid ABC transporter permease [Streptomyces canus]|uniref:amino acid ABC transporter permease n=1 Tax=Streptomyces canus TaxID=58343 RepID=UPI00371AE54C
MEKVHALDTASPAGGEWTTSPAETIPPIARRLPPGKVLGVIAVTVGVAMLVHALVTNPNFQWSIVGQYLTTHAILVGIVRTLELTVLSMAIGIVLGVVLGVMSQSANALISGAGWLYVWFFRGTPLLVQIIFWYNLASLYKVISLGIPFGPSFVHGSTNAMITPFVAAILSLGLNEGAYMAEIVRGGLLGVDRGQAEAGHSLGMTRSQAMRRIILPQAMRLIVPPTGNQTISMLKSTALVSVISMTELLHSVQQIYATNYQTIPLLIVASLWYLAFTSVLSVGQYFLERKLGRGSTHDGSGRTGLVRQIVRALRVRPDSLEVRAS